MPKKLSQDEVIKKIELLHPDYKLVSKFNGTSKPIKLKHLKCGNEYTIKKANMFLNEGKGLCPICRKNNNHSTKRINLDEFLVKLYDKFNERYTYVSDFINMNTKCKIKCNICNNIWEITPHMLFGGRNCPICSNKNRGKYLLKDNYLEKLIQNENYIWLEDYKGNNKIKHKIKHLDCGNEYEVRPNDFQQGYSCPYCSKNNISKEEKELKVYLENLNLKFISNFRNKKEIDIYFKDKNIGFEYNGFYWHSILFKPKYYHLEKYIYFKNKKINIFFINSFFWINKSESIKNVLNILLTNNTNFINYKKYYIERSNKIDKDFLEKFLINSLEIDKIKEIYSVYNYKKIKIFDLLLLNDNQNFYLKLVENVKYNNIDVIKNLIKKIKIKYNLNEINLLEDNDLHYLDKKYNLNYKYSNKINKIVIKNKYEIFTSGTILYLL